MKRPALRHLAAAHATFGRLMAGRKYQDVSRSALAYERGHGELLKQIEPAKNQYDANAREGAHPSTRTQAAEQAGMSEHQREGA